MPKLFRPKLNQATAKASNATGAGKPAAQELTVRSPTPPKTHTETTTARESTDIAKTPCTDASPLKTAQNSMVLIPQSPSAVDIDQAGSKKPNRKQPLRSKQQEQQQQQQEQRRQRPEWSAPAVELFKRKKPRLVTTKQAIDTIPTLPRPDQPLDRSSVPLNALIHWVPANKPPPSFRQDRSDSVAKADFSPEAVKKTEPTVNLKTESNSNAARTGQSTPLDVLAPQLRIDAEGNIVLDESSLLVSLPEIGRDDVSVRHVTEEVGLLNVTYNSFRAPRDRRGKRWPAHETVRFYRALSTFGRDFYLMAEMFPNRSRNELKSKFKNESRSNPYLVNQALRNRRTYDITSLLPLSDEEPEDEPQSEVKPSSKTDRTSSRTRTGSRSRGRPKNNTTIPPEIPSPDAPDSGKPTLPYNPDNVLATIDAVLAQTASSPVAPDPTEQQNQSQPSSAVQSTFPLERMIARAKRVVCQTDGDLTVPEDDQPVTAALPEPDRTESDSPAAQLEPVRLELIGEEHPKIDILLTGRKLLGD